MSRIFLNLAVALLLLVKVHNGSAVDTARLMDDNERNRAGSKLNNLLHAAAARRAGDLEEVKMPDDDHVEQPRRVFFLEQTRSFLTPPRTW